MVVILVYYKIQAYVTENVKQVDREYRKYKRIFINPRKLTPLSSLYSF